jgi:hypothetical protein
MRLTDLKRKPVKVNKTKDILNDLERSIQSQTPFSLIRFGDAGLGILAAYLCSSNINFGKKWGSNKGKLAAKEILLRLSIPEKKHHKVLQQVVEASNNANYIDSYDGDMIAKLPVGQLAFSWKEIHEDIGIKNNSYCSTFFHYFSIVENEYNLFDIMKDRKIFCINNIIPNFSKKLKERSKCKILDFYRIPGRGRTTRHYKNHYKEVCKIIKENARDYDIFLIGAGLLATIYCDVVKNNGGRALDIGTVFHLWKGAKIHPARPAKFLVNNKEKMLCERIKTPPKDVIGIW